MSYFGGFPVFTAHNIGHIIEAFDNNTTMWTCKINSPFFTRGAGISGPQIGLPRRPPTMKGFTVIATLNKQFVSNRASNKATMLCVRHEIRISQT